MGGLTGLRSDARPIDGDGVAAFTQATQERLGERGIIQEVLPRGILQVGGNERWLAAVSFFQKLEENVGLLTLYVDVP